MTPGQTSTLDPQAAGEPSRRDTLHRARLAAIRPALAGGRGHWGRQLMAVLAIALGTALGVAVNLINGAAVDEFAAAANQFGGRADLAVSAGRDGFDENLYARIAVLPGIAVASPVIDGTLPMRCLPLDPVQSTAQSARLTRTPGAKVAGGAASSDADAQPTRLLGLDLFRAVAVDPRSLPPADQAASLLNPGQALLSQGAASALRCAVGDQLAVLRGGDRALLTVAGLLPEDGSARSFVLLDIGYAQELLGSLGRLQRIDLRLAAGMRRADALALLREQLPAGVQAAPPDEGTARTAVLSRAYRANLTVLALIALFTGAFLVFTTQTLAVARRRTRVGLLRALGVERRQVLLAIALEGLQVGLAGSAIGVVCGTAVAAWALRHFGGDLGAGYFSGTHPDFRLDPWVLLTFLVLGTGCAVAGSLVPAWQAAQADPAQALHPGTPTVPAGPGRRRFGFALLALGSALCLSPPVFGLPLGGYVAIALLLVGLLALLPAFTESVLGV